MKSSSRASDVVIVGGGLAGQLTALALRTLAPHRTVTIVERAQTLSGNHTWCCHRSDLRNAGDAVSTWLTPLIDVAWPRHRVRFPRYERLLDGDYLCLRSSTLAEHSQIALAGAARTGRDVVEVSRNHVTLDTGERMTGALVLDARGGSADAYENRTGYQKFVGWEIEVDRLPNRLSHVPMLMDADVQQLDGYRFMYVLPFSVSRVLVEDTTFSRTPKLNEDALRGRLGAYLAERGVSDYRVVREEKGVLPMPWAAPAPLASALTIGYRGGFFHPGTGYSLARAVVVAQRLAEVVRDNDRDHWTNAAEHALTSLRASWAINDTFARWLNKIAFVHIPPTWLREAVFSPVYRLPEHVLSGFYAGDTRPGERFALATAPLRFPFFRPLAKQPPLLGQQP